jgi:large subunit ribosomal protein L10
LSLNLDSKKVVVAQVSETLGSAQTVVIAEYAGVTVETLTAIRREARKANVYLHVIKNTLTP